MFKNLVFSWSLLGPSRTSLDTSQTIKQTLNKSENVVYRREVKAICCQAFWGLKLKTFQNVTFLREQMTMRHWIRHSLLYRK